MMTTLLIRYAALVERPDGSTVKEVKGLDVIRRDWSNLARNTGQYVLMCCSHDQHVIF